MPSQYSFEIVGEDEDEGLRSILRETSMDGPIALSLQREPRFFRGEAAGNIRSQIMAVRDTATGQLIGLASRGIRRVFVDGEPATVGYLSGLRGLEEHRRGTLLARAYRYLKEVHRDGAVPYYLTTILDDNQYAQELLTSRRAGLPVYDPLGKIETYLLPLYRGRRRFPRRNIARGDPSLLEDAVARLREFNSRHQFAPVYTCEDLLGQTSLLPGFALQDLYTYNTAGKVTAVFGVWDQAAFKQYVVTRYARPYRLLQRVSPVTSGLRLSPSLPRVGKPLAYLHGAFLAYAPGHVTDLEALVHAALEDWRRKGYAYLAVGVYEHNPIRNTLRRLSAMVITSTLYLVYWEDCLNAPLPSRERIPHVEIATL